MAASPLRSHPHLTVAASSAPRRPAPRCARSNQPPARLACRWRQRRRAPLTHSCRWRVVCFLAEPPPPLPASRRVHIPPGPHCALPYRAARPAWFHLCALLSARFPFTSQASLAGLLLHTPPRREGNALARRAARGPQDGGPPRVFRQIRLPGTAAQSVSSMAGRGGASGSCECLRGTAPSWLPPAALEAGCSLSSGPGRPCHRCSSFLVILGISLCAATLGGAHLAEAAGALRSQRAAQSREGNRA